MRVAFVLNAFPLVSETFVLAQIVGLMQRGHEVDVFADRPPGDEDTVHPEVVQYRLLERTRYRVERPVRRLARLRGAGALLVRWGWRIPGRTLETLNVFRHGRLAINLRMLFDSMPWDRIDGGYDVIHCHFGPNGLRTVAAKRAGAFRAPVITTFHGGDANSLPRYFGPGYYRYLFHHGDLFTVGSDFMRRRIMSYGAPGDRIVCLPMGVDTSFFPFVPRRLPDDGGPINLLTVARLVEVKGIEYVLRAVALVKARYPQLRYTIAGDGPLRGRLEALRAELGITREVQFLGAVPRDAVPRLHRQAHIFILPSIVTAAGEEENQPVAVAEAQSSGLPVIATSIGGVPESIRNGESGWLVRPCDATALVAALTSMIEHPEATARMGEIGRRHVEANYELEELHDRLVALYREAAAASGVMPSVSCR
jgi:colanic acid/amylovoran biosynthesis glycosyltransferase